MLLEASKSDLAACSQYACYRSAWLLRKYSTPNQPSHVWTAWLVREHSDSPFSNVYSSGLWARQEEQPACSTVIVSLGDHINQSWTTSILIFYYTYSALVHIVRGIITRITSKLRRTQQLYMNALILVLNDHIHLKTQINIGSWNQPEIFACPRSKDLQNKPSWRVLDGDWCKDL